MTAALRSAIATLLGAVTLSLMLGVAPSKALEKLRVYRGVLVLEGIIVPGDYDKLRNFLGTKSNFDKISGGVFLASPGGNVAEAMRIGQLIRMLQLSTDAPSGPPTGSPKFGESSSGRIIWSIRRIINVRAPAFLFMFPEFIET